ncbi:MAG TPA: 50S ribosomal protein L29 [bacterium]|nr:50S ribosomal protein L29 [bacterium]HNS34287.1 50S ribosomal protein L29 [bacterium]HNW09284.1 50S ribosomal protein L29 [bacterium]HNZ73047.1 50S ribosomal protein L29 [bacterium]HOH67143.1 50S ribosomal protein L29 [bacterium]
MNINEINNKDINELNQLLGDYRKKLDDLKFKAAQKQLKNIREIRVIKKAIARILTVLAVKTKQVKK